MEFMKVIKKRQSIRNFSDQKIPSKIMEKILKAGQLSPSGGNAQNRYFGIVKDDKIKKDLAEAAGKQMWIAEAPIVIAHCAYIGYDLSEVAEDNFALIVNKNRFGRELISYFNSYNDRKMMNTFWNNSNPLIPGEHMLLAATNYGLSGCWVGYLDIRKATKILNLPDNIVCLFLMPLGYAAEKKEKKDKKSLEELVFYDRWK
jgi:nitroreductase